MIATNVNRPFLLLATGLALAGCSGPAGDHEVTEEVVQGTVKETELLSVGGRLFSIPSPVQAALAIRDAGLAYQRDLTVPLDKGSSAVGKADEAVLLGMHGADLAYVTVHKDGQRALATLAAIEKLGNKLGLGNAFDNSLLEGFRNNISNEDSLLRSSGKAFRAADQYLKNNDRDDVSALVLAGGWVESMHLALSDAKTASDPRLVGRIGDQRNALEGLVQLLAAIDRDPRMEELFVALQDLRTAFAGVSTTYTYQAPVTDVSARTTYINSVSQTTIPEELLVTIAAKVGAIRSQFIG